MPIRTSAKKPTKGRVPTIYVRPALRVCTYDVGTTYVLQLSWNKSDSSPCQSWAKSTSLNRHGKKFVLQTERQSFLHFIFHIHLIYTFKDFDLNHSEKKELPQQQIPLQLIF